MFYMSKILLFLQKILDMKKYIIVGAAILFTMMAITLLNLYNRAVKYENLYERELQNVEAYRNDNAGLEGEIRQYKMTVDELYASRDSIDRKLVEVKEKLKIADNQIQSMQYNQTVITKIDSFFVHDTIFKEGTAIDTTVGDYWFNTRLQLFFPSTIIVNPTVNSEQFVYIYNKKEYRNTPSKIFFIRWFQKKFVVTEVKVEEKNPYIKIVKQKFIKVE